jgi:hypothetical protein
MLGMLVVLTAMFAAAPAGAQVYPWCAEYAMRGGATNCFFATLQQCQWAISGNGGFCRRNLFYTGPANGAAPRKKRQRG